MTTVLQQVLERIEQLSEQLTPEEQTSAAEQLQQVLDRLESDRQWDVLFATPESQAFLREMAVEAIAEYERGETEEGGFGF